jgi:hypothetical protein
MPLRALDGTGVQPMDQGMIRPNQGQPGEGDVDRVAPTSPPTDAAARVGPPVATEPTPPVEGVTEGVGRTSSAPPPSRLVAPDEQPAPSRDQRPVIRAGQVDRPELTAPAGCTAPQLRRFIKSRPYIPMHELRRRFGINGTEDDVTPVDLAVGRIFVGLPSREGGLLGELLRGGEVGYELSLDPRSPVVVGLYPMRPVPRS